jgi:hypothetical protein
MPRSSADRSGPRSCWGQAAAATPTSIRTLTCFYVDELPPEKVLPEIRATVGGTHAMRRGGAEEPFLSEEFVLDGVRTKVSFVTVDRTERRLVCATFGSAHHRGKSGSGSGFAEADWSQLGCLPETASRILI